MTRDDVLRLTERVTSLADRLAAEPRLAAEVLRARRQFFGTGAGGAAGRGDDAAEHRFVEWFLLERESETLGAVPCSVPPFAEAATALQGSMAGVFLVQSSGPTGVFARDLQDDAVVELAVAGVTMAPGDLLVGRLYPTAGERWLPSVAAPLLRPGRDLAAAFGHDLDRLGLERRLQQIELEHLLLRRSGSAAPADDAPQQPPLEHLEADLERLLLAARARHSATAISQQLAQVERPGQVVGPLLDQLAFETDVDLDRVRQILLEIWNAHRGGALGGTAVRPSAGAVSRPPGETLGERLARTLDEGLQQKRDVGELFAQLESMAGIDGDQDDDDPAEADEVDEVDEFDDGADDEENDGGDLAPLIEEYLWETGRDDTAAAPPLRLFGELQKNAPVPRTDLERIEGSDLMRLLLHVYLRALPARRAADVREAFAELGRFYDWVAATQEIERRDVLQECRGALLDQLDRLQTAGEQLSSEARPERAPGVLQVEDVGPAGFGVRDDDGGHHWLAASPAAVRCLRVGDLVLGALGPAPAAPGAGRALAGLVVVLPIDARTLIE